MSQLNKNSILFISRYRGTGGAERTLIPLAHFLAEQQYELTLFQVTFPEDKRIFADFPGEVIFPKDKTIFGKLQHLWHLNQAISEHDLTIATSELTPTYLSWLCTCWHHKPFIADVQVCLSQWIRDNSNLLHNYLSCWIYPRIRHIRCVAEATAYDLQMNYNVPPKHCQIIHVPFDLDQLRQQALAPLPADHQARFVQPALVGIGRLTSQKRFDLAIQAIHTLQQKYNLDINLIILGEGEDRPQLEQQISALNLQQSVHLLGFVANPYPYLRQADAFLLSSDYEGLPRVLIEALALGCPCIATDCPSGPAEILEQGKWGILTPTGDSDALAAAIAELLQSPQNYQQLKEQSPQRAQIFNSPKIVKQYYDLIRQVIENEK